MAGCLNYWSPKLCLSKTPDWLAARLIKAIKCFQGAARPKLATAALKEKVPDLGGM